jgi:dTDP-4-dehydrorhamnose reductase
MDTLILGHKGMLGHMVQFFLEKKSVNITTTSLKFPSQEFKDFVLDYNGAYIINCIGAIPQKTKIFEINYDLPIWLEENVKCRVIHPGTDCEMDDDDYGISKKRASSFIKLKSNKTKILKSSIIGPELNSKFSLMEWLLSSEDHVFGYSQAMWNGNTTLEWAKNCYDLMLNWETYNIETILEGECLSKYNLLKKIKRIFSKEISILAKEEFKCNKCLKGEIKTKNIENQLEDLKKEYYNK